jgi:CheY-like chemotaxis protein
MKKVLLVDDDEPLRRLFTLALRANGYFVIEAESGSTGFKMALKYLPDLILSDIFMPGGDGLTFLRNIRHDPELRSKQVVLMSGMSEVLTLPKDVEERPDDFLAKPFKLQALLTCLQARFVCAAVSQCEESQMVALWSP